MKLISEQEFYGKLIMRLKSCMSFGCVTGPGRSGAIAAVYASHFLRIPFLPFGKSPPAKLGKLLIIDTATFTGKTAHKASRKYKDFNHSVICLYQEPPMVKFWYESPKPQHYKHETI